MLPCLNTHTEEIIVNPGTQTTHKHRAKIKSNLNNSTPTGKAIARDIFEQENMTFGEEQCTNRVLSTPVAGLTPCAYQ